MIERYIRENQKERKIILDPKFKEKRNDREATIDPTWNSLLTNYEVNRVVETRHFLIVLVLINLDDRIRNSRSRRIKIKDYDTGISYFSGVIVLTFWADRKFSLSRSRIPSSRSILFFFNSKSTGYFSKLSTNNSLDKGSYVSWLSRRVFPRKEANKMLGRSRFFYLNVFPRAACSRVR